MTGCHGCAGTGSERSPLCSDQEKAGFARLNVFAARFFRDRLPGSWVSRYLEDRGFTSAVQARWQVGYAPATWGALTRRLLRLGCSDTLIEQSGLGRRSGRGTLIDTFRDRAMFPVRSANGTLAGFIGRAAEDAAPGVPKYLNSPASCLYSKGMLLFGLWEAHEALAAEARPVIVEGPLDAIAVTTAGQGHIVGVAPCGTALTVPHISALSRVADLRSAGVLVAFDADPAGQRAAVRAYDLLSPLTVDVATVMLPAGCDPAQMLADRGPAALAGMLARHTRPLADLVIDDEVRKWRRWLRYPEGQIGALRAAAPLIAAMPPAHVARQIARLTARLCLDHATVTRAVIDALPEILPAQTAHQRSPQEPERA
jgi:DNA primase catalytic core